MAGMYGCFKNRNSDSAAMASGTSDVTATQEPAEVAEECSGKKKSKFQTFKKFFARKKRKEPPAAGADAGLKASQSSDNVSKTSENNALTRSEKDKGSGSKISLGSKALSHDSVFVSDSSEANEALGASQDSIHGKVKSLQLQLKQAIKLGSPPSLNCVKRTEDAGTMSEDDGLPCSPPEYTTMSQAQRNSSVSLEGADSDDDQLSCAASSRAVSPLVVPGDFSQPASPYGCLDNSAAKHKRGLRNKACHKRKPIKRLEIKADGDSEVEKSLDASVTEAPEEKQNAAEVVKADELKPEVEAKEKEDNGDNDEEEEEEEEEVKKPQEHSLLRDKEEEEEEEEESIKEQDASHAPDTSSAPELCLSEEESPDGEPPPSSETSSRASSSVDSPRATPEPPAGPRESTLDPSSVARGADEERLESDLKTEENESQYKREEEPSLLQEVLSSLKTPLESCSLGVEAKDVLLKVQEDVKEREGEGVESDENEEVMEEDVEVEEPVGYQAAPAGALLSDRTAREEEEEREEEYEEEEEERVEALSRRTPEEEEKAEDAEELALVEEEEPVTEPSSQHDQIEEEETEEAEEAKPEEQNSLLAVNAEIQPESKNRAAEEESEGEEVMEVGKEPEVEEVEEEGEALGEPEAKEAAERVEEAEAAEEDEEEDNEEEMMEQRPAAAAADDDDDAEEVKPAMQQQEADEGVEVVVGDDALFAEEARDDNDDDDDDDDDEAPAELDDQVLVLEEERESLEASSQRFEEESRRDGEEEGAVMDHMEDKSDEEEEDEADQQDADPTEHEDEQHEAEKSIITKQSDVPPQRPSLSLPPSREDVPLQEDGAISPSKTRTTTLHINLLSPSSEKSPAFFQQSPPAAHPKETETASDAVTPSERNAAPAEKEAADTVEAEEEEEEEEQSSPEEEERPAAVEETVEQLPGRSGQNKVRFTIAPAWQRSLSAEEEEEAKESLTPPPSEPACVSSPSPAVTGPGDVEDEAAANREPDVKAESESPAKVEPALSPARAGNAEAATSATASTEEPSVIVEGNPDNPFGVKLRKTSVLHRFSSEEESTESPVEPPAPATSSKVDPPQPVSVKPSITQPNINKPALPKKPDLHGDSAGKNKRISDPPAARGLPGGSESPSWISVAKQKQKIYKENSLEETSVKKEEQEKKSSLPMYVASAASRENNNNKTADSTSKVSPMEISKPPETVEETRKAVSPLAPVPYHPPKSLPCPIPPKPQVPTAKPSPQRFLPTPVPVPQKSPSCTSPSSVSNTPQPQSTAVTSPPFSPRTAPEKSVPRVAGLPSQTPSSPRGLPPQALPQDEPPWMALAKKKAKAWSEMPQIVQ